MGYKYMCVVDSEGYFVSFVQVVNFEGQNAIRNYSLSEGENLIEAAPPSSDVFARPRWVEGVWNEGGTAEEIEQWKSKRPAIPGPSEINLLRAELEEAKAQLAILTGGEK